MIKKILLIFTALLSVVSVQAYRFGGIDYYLDQKNIKAHVTSKHSGQYSGDIVIPHYVTYNGMAYEVTSIGGAFRGCTGLTSITIPNSVTSIGDQAFYGCTGLTSVTIPNSVTSIEYGAFSGCTGLTSVSIGNSVTGIGDWAFSGCTGLTSVTIPNSVTSIGDSAFDGCTGLTSITIPNSVTSIERQAFSGCTGLTSVTIPNSVTSIESVTFSGCTGLTSITIPNSVTSIGGSAFYGCTSLTSITIPDGVTSIGGSAFRGCTGLTSITIPDGVTSIGEKAFSGCTYLTSVTIGNSVTSIEGWAFDDCTSLTSITIPNSVTSIGKNAFLNCTSLTSITIGNSVTSIGENAFRGCTGLTSITIPNSVTSIEYHTFQGCTGLTSITIPNSVTSIDGTAFSGCTGLTSIVWNANRGFPYGYILGYDPFECVRTQITSFTFGESIDTIPSYICDGMEKLTSITISNSVRGIKDKAFSGCTNLAQTNYTGDIASWCAISFGDNPIIYSHNLYINGEEITNLIIPNSVTSIGENAFRGCTGLTSVTIDNSVTSIGDDAFVDCRNLCKVNYTGDVKGWLSIDIGSNPIYYSRNLYLNDVILTDLIIPDGATKISDAFAYDTCLTSITIPNSVTSIGNYAFSGCTSLTSVVWNARNCSNFSEEDTPFYVKKRSYYDKGGFDIRSQITSFIFGDSVQHIPAWLCSGMKNLDSVTIPNSVTSIGDKAFTGCSWLSSIIVESGNPVYDSRDTCNAIIETATNTLIQGCRNTTIPNSVTKIREYAFYDCSSLTSVAIPNSVTEIGESAFSDCFLQSVFINSNTIHIEENAFDYCQSLIIGEDVKKIRAPYAFSQRLKKIYIRAETPPTILYLSSSFSSPFSDVPPYIPVYIPCGTKETYQLASGWEEFVNFIESKGITLTITTQDEQLGKVKIIKNGTSCAESESVFEAIANEGYIFTHWSDGNTDNPRHLVPTQDSVIVALFRGILSYSVTVDCNPEQGSVSGSGIYAETEPVIITATANTGYRFSRWSDGNTDNPRTLTLTSDTTLTAEFIPATAVENVSADGITPQKVFRNGQVYILRGDNTYTTMGVEVNL